MLEKIGAYALAIPIILLIYVLCIPFIMYSAWVTTILWGWFVVPFGLPYLTLPWAFGLSLVISRFTHVENYYRSPDDKYQVATAFSVMTLGPAMSLLVGFIVHNYM